MSVSGFAGFSLLVWQVILGTRSLIGLFIDDLPWALKIHKYLGIWGTLLVFAHPIALTIAWSLPLAYPLMPDFSSNYEIYVSFGRMAVILLLLVWFTSAIIKSRIKYRPWKYIHYLSYFAIVAAAIHGPYAGTSYSSKALSIVWYSMVILLIIALAMRLKFYFGIGRCRYLVTSNQKISQRSYLLQLQPQGGRQINNQPGQYLYIQLSSGGEYHPFSILYNDTKTGIISLGYKTYGKFTERMSRLQAGSSVFVDGAYGVFTSNIPPSDQAAIMIAGGIGITPFYSRIADSKRKRDVLFYCFKDESQAPLLDPIRSAMGERLIEVVGDDPDPVQRLINKQLLLSRLGNPIEYSYFICGPPGLISATRTILNDLGVNRRQIHAEEFNY